ncbi:MAG: hypothetical protein WBP58_15790 [Chitinophagaceae bacterium]
MNMIFSGLVLGLTFLLCLQDRTDIVGKWELVGHEMNGVGTHKQMPSRLQIIFDANGQWHASGLVGNDSVGSWSSSGAVEYRLDTRKDMKFIGVIKDNKLVLSYRSLLKTETITWIRK